MPYQVFRQFLDVLRQHVYERINASNCGITAGYRQQG